MTQIAGATGDPDIARRCRPDLWSKAPGSRYYPVSRRAVALIVIGFVFWTIYPELSQFNLDRFRDMLENYAWGIRWQWGNSKHPPLFGWITAAWFELFARTDLAYRALASLNIAAALGLMVAIARRFLAPPQQDVAVLTALVLPLLGFLAFKYNANSAMLPFWAATVLFYLRVLEKRRLADAVVLGLSAGAAMLCKYYSAVLLMALLLHALSHRQGRAIVLSPLVLAVVASFAAVFVPHLVWLFDNQFGPIRFAADGQGDSSFAAQAYRQAEFVLAQLVYALPGLAIMALLRRPGDGQPLFDIVQARTVLGTARGQVLLWVGVGTVPIAMMAAIAASSPLTSNWSMPAFVVVPILLALWLPFKIAAAMRNWTFGLALGFMALMLALSPLIRSAIVGEGSHLAAVPLRDLARQAEQVWIARTGRALAFVGGQTDIDYAVAFYAQGRPQAIEGPNLDGKPWIDRASLAQEGAMVICLRAGCIDAWTADPHWTWQSLGQVSAPPPQGARSPGARIAYLWRARWSPRQNGERQAGPAGTPDDQ